MEEKENINVSDGKPRKVCGKLLPLRVISLFLYLIATCILTVYLVSIYLEPDELGQAVGLIFFITLFLTWGGSIVYGLSLILSMIGLIITFRCAAPERKRGQIVFFTVTSILSAFTYAAFWLIVAAFPLS